MKKIILAVAFCGFLAACASTEKPVAGPELYNRIRAEAKAVLEDIKLKDSDDIQKAAQSRKFLEIGFFFALDPKGNVLAHPNGSMVGKNISEIYDKEYLKEILADKETIFIISTSKGHSCHYFYKDTIKKIIVGFSVPVKIVLGKYSL